MSILRLKMKRESYRCAKQQNMKKKYTSMQSETDLEFLKNATDDDLNFSDSPDLSTVELGEAEVRFNHEPVSTGKVRINIYLDADIVAFFKAKAGGRGYQTLINQALRNSIDSARMEALLRQVIREEMAPYHISQDDDDSTK